MKDYNKPLPQATPWSRPFWRGCKEHKLLIQKCKECEKFIFYPKLFCPYCLSLQMEWVQSSGEGRIYSYSIVQSYAPTEFADEVPYIVAVIELDEGVRMMSNIVDCAPEKVSCDMRVKVVFDDITEDITLVKFRPV